MNTIPFQKNDVIFRQNDFADSMYKILSGSVRIVTDYGEDCEKEIRVLKDGDYFGEMGLVEAYPRSATAVVCSETAEVTEFGIEDFQRIFKEDPENVMTILRQLAERLRLMDQVYRDAVETVEKAKAEQTKDEAPDKAPKTALQRLRDYYLSFIGR